MSIDTLADFFTIIRNGLAVSKRKIVAPSSKMKENIAIVLKEEGYIKDFEIQEEKGKKRLVIFLKYFNGESVIHELKRISKSSRRCYERTNRITQVIGGLGVSIISTSSGIVTDRQAKKLGVGGEIIGYVW